MSALTLPLTFSNSFWTQDYRRGLETLYGKLEQGIAENDEIIAFIRARVIAEKGIADSLTYPAPTGPGGIGFGADEGASLLVAFRGIQAESIAQGEVHRSISKELESLVVDPFEKWAEGHKERVINSRKNIVDSWLKSYELAQGDVDKLKHSYLTKVRRADEAEDDAKFAPNTEVKDKFTASPKLTARDHHPRRSASVSERIAQRIKDIQGRNPLKSSFSGMSIFEGVTPTEEPEEKPLPPLDKGKGKAIEESDTSIAPLASPPALSLPLASPESIGKPPASPMPPPPPSPMLLAGLALPPSAVSDLLSRAASELPLRPIKVPIMGEYQDCFTGEEFVTWLKESVQGFGDSWDRAEDAARDLTEVEGVLRRVGEFGNKFESTDDAFYQFRPKAFNLHVEYTRTDALNSAAAGLAPLADTFVKRSGTLIRNVSKAINNSTNSAPLYIRAREEAEAADKRYRVAIRKLDRQRLSLEDTIEETLKLLQKWETDRLNAVKTVLLQFRGTLANLPAALQPSLERSATLIASYQPESDLKALIERYRTGPFRPVPQVYESISHDEFDVVFGIDLRKWAEGGWNGVKSGEDKKDKIPEVVTALLAGLTEAYQKLPNDLEKRRTWIYEVPLQAVHHLRESINAVPVGKPISSELLAKYDAPVLASTFKLWMLELDPPLGLWEGWDDIRRIYPSVGATTKSSEEEGVKQTVQDLLVALQRLPKVHLLVLDVFLRHLKTLIDTTTVEEPNDRYITKLALSLGRTILRPKYETEMSIQDRHPTVLFIDLLTHFDEIIPPTIVRKKRESDRRLPLKKRTAPIDMRVSRSKLSVDADAQDVLSAQLAVKNPNYKPASRNASPAGERTPGGPQAPATLAEALTPENNLASENKNENEAVIAPVPETLEAMPAVSVTESVTSEPVAAPALVPAIPDPVPINSDANDDGKTPPRPMFKEPPPELDDYVPPPMPRFVEPPPENENASVPIEAPVPSVPSPVVVPPTPQQKPLSPADRLSSIRTPSPSPARSRAGSRAGSPSSPVYASGDDRPGANLSRSSSGEANRLRGSRRSGSASLNPRTSSVSITGVISGGGSPGGNGSAAGARLQRSGLSRPSSIVNPAEYEPKRKGGRAQAGAFSRRTMASDAEDEVVSKTDA